MHFDFDSDFGFGLAFGIDFESAFSLFLQIDLLHLLK